jgi:outer membrane protein assembly factor BamB
MSCFPSRWLAGPWALALLLAAPLVAARADDWPQWLGPQRDGVWREKDIVDRFPVKGPPVRWRAPVGGGYAGPAVAGDRVYLTDRILDSGVKDPTNLFARASSPGKERILCLEEATGKVLWQHSYSVKYEISYPCGPRCTPLVREGRVYCLGAMGHLVCLDAQTGQVHWSKNLPQDYKARIPLWGYAAHPMLDGDKLICLVGGDDSVVVAFEAASGKEKWRALSFERGQTELGYCPPMLIEAGGTRQLIIWHPEAVNSLDPETGKVYWSQKFRLNANMAIATPQLAGDLLLVSAFYNGSMMLRLSRDTPAAKLVWQGQGRGETPNRTDTLHSVMATPFIRDGFIYGVCSYGELRCVRAADGERIWEDLRATGRQKEPVERWANAFLTPQNDRWFLFNEKGDLIIARLSPRGYDEIDRTHLLEPTGRALERHVVWSHPAYAHKCIFVRNDKEIVCASLAKQ